MSYAFGKVFSTTLSTSVGSQTFSIDVPLETLADAALKAAAGPAVKYGLEELKPQIQGLLTPALQQAGHVRDERPLAGDAAEAQERNRSRRRGGRS